MSKTVYAEGINGDVLRWARVGARLSLEEAAKVVGKSPDVIDGWERGKTYPTLGQLEALAKKYARPLAVFFFPAPPTERPVGKSFRALPAFAVEGLASDTHLAVRQARSMQLALHELTGARNPFGEPLPALMEARRYVDDVEGLASILRAILGVSVETQLGWRNAESALSAWREAVERRGVFVFKRSFEQRSVSGFCLPDDRFPVIYLNNSHHFTRQIFTLFHETAHLLFGRGGITAKDESFVSAMKPRDQKVESACDALAEVFLIPRADLDEQLPSRRQEASDADIARAARRYHVSEQVVLYRLARLRPQHAASYRTRANERATRGFQRPRPDAEGGNWYATRLAYLGRNFLRIAFQSHADGRLTYEQLADSIGVKARNLPGLEQRLYRAENGNADLLS